LFHLFKIDIFKLFLLKMEMSLQNVPKDVFHILCSFMLPRDLVRLRTLSREYAHITNEYLIRTKNKTKLFELVCPLCGNDWINNSPIHDYLDIDDEMHYFEVNERNSYISTLFYGETKRDHLLCEECEDTMQENPYLSHYKLPCNYEVYIDYCTNYPWAVLIKNGSKIIWNQYNCIIDPNVEMDSDLE